MSPEAMAYLTVALDYLQAHSVRRDHIDWPALRQEAEARAAQAQTPADTYPAICRALELLGDMHSHFLTPEQVRRLNRGQEQRMGFQMIFPCAWIGDVLPGSPAEQAGLRIGDHVETVNGLAVTSLTEAQLYAARRQVPLALTVTPAQGGGIRSVQLEPATFEVKRRPWGRRLGDDVGYLAVPAVMSLEAGRPFAAWAHHLIQEIDQTPTAGWVIDLRTNLGGSLWPMLASVGPIVGEGEIMGFVAPGEKLIAFYRAGRAWIEGQVRISTQVDEPYRLKRPNPPVAVLTSQLTTSAGELTALAFRGRPHARSFGEPTVGVPTANDDKALSDEATIYLTAYLGADRTGQTYSRPLLPDEMVSLDWPRFGADDDPVLEAAVRWLRGQASVL